MGSAKSKNVLESTMQAITRVSTDIVQNTNLVQDQAQIMTVQGGTGNVKINGNKQELKLQINMDGLQQAMVSTEVQTALFQELEQLAKSSMSGINLLQFPDAENRVASYMSAVIKLSTNISQDCNLKGKQTQIISVIQQDGHVEISDNVQSAMADLFVNCVQAAAAKNEAIIDMQNMITQSAESQAKGISEWALVALAFIALLAIVLPIVLPLALGINAIMRYLFPILGALIFLLGVGLLLWYLIGSPEDIIQTVSWSKGGKACGVTPMEQRDDIQNPVEAGEICLANKQCQAFDWVGWDTSKPGETVQLEPAKTTFYSSIGSRCKQIIETSLDPKPKMVYRRAWTVGREVPEGTGAIGSVYVRSATGDYYIFTDREGWGVPQGTKLPNVPEGKQLFAKDGSPAPEDGKSGDVWIDTSNPNTLVVYDKKGSSWEKREGTVPGPGFFVDVPIPLNTTGWRQSVKDQWKLIVGVVLMILGVALVAIFLLIQRYGSTTHAPATSTART